jgi:hypothetical protein
MSFPPNHSLDLSFNLTSQDLVATFQTKCQLLLQGRPVHLHKANYQRLQAAPFLTSWGIIKLIITPSCSVQVKTQYLKHQAHNLQ